MKHFIVYDMTSGGIRRVGLCMDVDFERQAHPENNEAVIEGNMPWANTVIDGVAVYVEPPPLPPPTSEEIALRDEKQFAIDCTRAFAKAIFNHENRVRVLEGKAPITWEQFKSAIRGMA